MLALEVGKGALAAGLGSLGDSFWTPPLCTAAGVAGHIWPVFLGFRGGGGLAAAIGFSLVVFPLEAIWMLSI